MHRQMTDKVIGMCRYALQGTQKRANIPNLSVIILIALYAIKHVICAIIIQIHGSANDLICICLDFYLNKIELNWSEWDSIDNTLD